MKSLKLTALIFSVASLTQITAQAAGSGNGAYGVVEIGASGIKGQVVKSDANPSSRSAKVKEYAPVDANAYAMGPSDSDRIKLAVAQIREQMRNDFDLPPGNFYVVGSSGLPDNAKAVLSTIDYGDQVKIDFVTPEQETIFLFRGTVPIENASEVVSLDIGSGNSKGAYLEKSDPRLVFASFAIPWGTKTGAKRISDLCGDGDFLSAADTFRAETFLPAIRSQAEQFPGMQNRRYVYLSGGIVWAMETLLHPFQTDELQKITTDDVTKFCQGAASDAKLLLHPDVDSLSKSNLSVSPAMLQAAGAEVARVATVFNEDQIIAGSLLLKAFAVEMRWNQKTSIFFCRTALNAWPRGYLLEKISEQPRK